MHVIERYNVYGFLNWVWCKMLVCICCQMYFVKQLLKSSRAVFIFLWLLLLLFDWQLCELCEVTQKDNNSMWHTFGKLVLYFWLYLRRAPVYLWIISASRCSLPNDWQCKPLISPMFFFITSKSWKLNWNTGYEWKEPDLRLNNWKAVCILCHMIRSNLGVLTGLNGGFDVTNQNNVEAKGSCLSNKLYKALIPQHFLKICLKSKRQSQHAIGLGEI